MDEVIDLAPAIAMIRGRMGQIDPELSALEGRASELRKERTKLTAALRAIDPSFSSNGKPKKKYDSYTISESHIEEVRRFIEEHLDELPEEGFTARTLVEASPFGKDRIRRALPILHERQVLHVARVVSGGGKVYKVVA